MKPLQLSTIIATLVTVQLNIIEGIVIRDALDRLDILIDKHSDALALCGQIGRTLTDVAAGLLPEDEAHQVNAQCLDLADVFRFPHTTNLNYHGTNGINGLTE